ncbi:MAG TPA: A/G-specific adenine glycosylase [Burkholderiales bacterium]|nr:A/G-specific adenine glycosylase [Burkholderiales bacterium]
MSAFAGKLVRWQARHGRHDLPWQRTRDPYRIWISEVMLQQTQVGTVIPYFRRFLARFPDVESLASAAPDDVLALWSGLGYYSRARNLHAAAQAVVTAGGRFPRTRDALEALPGIGRSTAAAIAVFAFGEREAILDGNVKRVFARHFAVRGFPGEKRFEKRLWGLAEAELPARNIETYTQSLMDLGAGVCTRKRPGCSSCPVIRSCAGYAQGKMEAYPASRPRKTRPVRKTSMLLLLREGEVLLEKRPPSGVWGGLWCLPEMPMDSGPGDYCQRRFGAKLVGARRLAILHHGFTHFELDIAPLLCLLDPASHCAAEPGQVWLPLEEAGGAALPAPVKKLLASVGSNGLGGEPAALEKALQD